MLITAAEVCANPDDHAQLLPMLEQAEEITGSQAQLTLADAGYHSCNNLKACARDGRPVLMPDPKRKYRGGQYHKDRFIYDASGDTYTCPEGQRLRFSRYMQANTARVRLYERVVVSARVVLHSGFAGSNPVPSAKRSYHRTFQ